MISKVVIYVIVRSGQPLFQNGKLIHPYFLDACPVCRHEKWNPLFEVFGFQLCRCSRCRFLCFNPRLNELGSLQLNNSPYSNNIFEFAQKPMILRHGLWSRTLRYDLPKLADYLISFCPGGRVLDIGCGPGVFLAALPPESFLRIGIEPNAEERSFAIEHFKLNIIPDTANLAEQKNTFDAVTAIEVIEHVHDPYDFLSRITEFAKPNGYVLLTTPNIACWDYSLYRRRCAHLSPPLHINFFSLATLTKLAQRCNLSLRGHGYRGSDFSFSNWLQSRGKHLDFISPETPFRDSGAIYKDDRDRYELPQWMILDNPDSPGPDAPPPPLADKLSRLPKKIYYRTLRLFAGQPQMVAIFQKNKSLL